VGIARIPKRVKLIVGLIARDADLLATIKKALERALRNKVDLESGVMDFIHTGYYAEEMGCNLKRKFLSFRKPIDLKNAYAVKLKTNAIERRFSKDGKRAVNIDPGYLDLSKLVLFSTKDYTHRIYLNKGIYAEITLFYKDKTFRAWPWTYPDYKTDEYIDLFNKIRDIHKENIGA